MKKFITKARNYITLQHFADPTHTLYDNFVLERKMTDLVNTKLEARSLMTIDYSLTESAGMKKTIHKYTYSGTVEKLTKGSKNTDSALGKVVYTSTDYTVGRYQQTFKYYDEDVMKDPYMLDVATTGASTLMANEVKDEYFTELDKISNSVTFAKTGTFSYETIVDALAEIGCEAEEDTFIIMGTDMKAMIRKDPDFKAAQQGQILYAGQFGTISGVPVLFSKKVPADTAYVTKKTAIKFFVKKDAPIEQDRDVQTKQNIVVYARYGLIALVDDTESVKITRATA